MRAFFLFTILLAGCGAGLREAKTKTTTSNEAFYVQGFSPAAGTVSSLPTTVVVTFNRDDVVETTVQALTTFNLICGNDIFSADAVAYTAGVALATVTLPVVSGVPVGTKCQFSVAASVRDTEGNYLKGTRYVNYVLGP